ncbi:hypothetical protein BH10ACI3_BH10ACI3_12750 [soil metagenome]
MQNKLKSIVLVFGVAAGVFVFTASKPQVAAASAVANSNASPRSLYVQYCSKCHGSDGRAQTAKGIEMEADDLTTSNASTEKIIRVITNGKAKMPSFKKKLSTAQIKSIAGYVHSM